MQKNIFYKLGMTAIFSVVLAACSTTGSDEEADQAARDAAAAEAERQAREAREAREAEARGAGERQQPSAEELREQEMLAQTTFYFDFDRSDLKPDAREALVYHANRLKDNPNLNVRLEGHADERGTREYNLALGERRAQAVERYLQVQGVAGRQIETISYGEEMPVDTGSNEQAYSRNRRVELVYEG